MNRYLYAVICVDCDDNPEDCLYDTSLAAARKAQREDQEWPCPWCGSRKSRIMRTTAVREWVEVR